jgi:hypothetical protein
MSRVLGVVGPHVDQVEAARDGVEQLALLLLRGREDHHGVLVEQLGAQLLRAEDHAQGLIDQGVAQEERDLGFAAHILVEDEVDVGGTGQGLEHGLEWRVAELQGDGLHGRGQ